MNFNKVFIIVLIFFMLTSFSEGFSDVDVISSDDILPFCYPLVKEHYAVCDNGIVYFYGKLVFSVNDVVDWIMQDSNLGLQINGELWAGMIIDAQFRNI